MKVKRAVFSNYRNIASEEIELSPSVNVLWGLNAQGKSNILEGIYYFARGRSFRGAKDRELISFDSPFASIGVDVERDGAQFPVRLEVLLRRDAKKRLSRNGAVFSSVSEMIGNLRAVLFCPAHLSMISGSPSERRQFLDIALSQLHPEYIDLLSVYKAALGERNALLRRASSGSLVSREEWEVYAAQMSESAAGIAKMRLEYADELATHISSFFHDMTDGREVPSVEYESHLLPKDAEDGEPFSEDDAKERLYNKLISNLDREQAAGSTLWGVHKDDLKLSINGCDTRLYASQGQQRSFALAMKLAEGEISRKSAGEYPVFLLDDVFSELDAGRRAFIMDKLSGRQIVVTSCEPSVIPDNVSSSDVTFMEVSGGRIRERK